MSQRVVQSSLANLFVSPEVCLWSASVQEDSVDSCDSPDPDRSTAFPFVEDDVFREWRQKFLSKRNVQSFECRPTLVIPKIRHSQR